MARPDRVRSRVVIKNLAGLGIAGLLVLFVSSAQAADWKFELEKKSSGGIDLYTPDSLLFVGSGDDGERRFRNMSGFTWTSLVLTVFGAPEDDDDRLSDLSCTQEGGLFAACNIGFTATPETGDEPMTGTYVFTFSGGPGIGHGQSFEIDWDEWSDNPTHWSGQGYSIPEPGTMALFLTGLAAVGLRRRFQVHRA
jgi:hypothetical protein